MADSLPRRRLAAQVMVATLVRWVINVGHRMAYPFLPAIARGLGVSLASAGLLMTARSAVGLASPLFGPLSDRFGRRRMMAAGLLLLSGGSILIALIPRYPAAVVGFLLLGLAKIVFDPSLQAYLGDRVPYHRRGLVIAVTELSWAGAILLGAPAIGWLIERAGWRMPFGVLAALAVAGLAIFLWALPNDDRGAGGAFARSFSAAFRLVLGQRAAVGALAVTFLLMMANEVLFIVYGTWMETSFGLSVSRLGLATTVIGMAELLGEIGVGGLADRLGKRRSVAAGLALTSAAYAALPLVSTGLRLALGGLFLIFLGFEFTIVAVIPLATELVP
ncbi:MAG: MFS transporter, partial [Anaerolineae bacterium]|nr:MFS transporter [Anaerolineae bacterium]